ncbi:MAG: hypothetical protein CM15mP49_09280 [Actinomycetota bacterium]|nr:MAG: hypothetical protein CM15mP49_09280 [Actinomycetota bacterium]
MKEIKVELADRSYPVLVGSGCLGRIEEVLSRVGEKGRYRNSGANRYRDTF